MSKTLKVSLVIPVFNEGNQLERCLQLISKQSHMPDEVIIVDNNSTDNSMEIAAGFNFVKVIHEPRQGIVYARDAGFDAAKGQIIARIDADTHLPHSWIAKVLKFYENPHNLDKALTGGGFFYNIRLPRFNGWLQSQLAFRTNRFIMGHYILWGSNMAFTREQWLLVRDRVCRRNDIHEDLDLAIHLHRLGFAITYQSTLSVGVKLKRVWENRWEQRKHAARWPRTLRVHGFKLWWMGSLGNVFLAMVGEPYIFVSEGLSRLFGRSKLS